jgi:hypothetical protein
LTAITKPGDLVFNIGIKKWKKELLDLFIPDGYSLLPETFKKAVINIKRRAAGVLNKTFGPRAEVNEVTIGQAGAVIIGLAENILQMIINESTREIHSRAEYRIKQ